MKRPLPKIKDPSNVNYNKDSNVRPRNNDNFKSIEFLKTALANLPNINIDEIINQSKKSYTGLKKIKVQQQNDRPDKKEPQRKLTVQTVKPKRDFRITNKKVINGEKNSEKPKATQSNISRFSKKIFKKSPPITNLSKDVNTQPRVNANEQNQIVEDSEKVGKPNNDLDNTTVEIRPSINPVNKHDVEDESTDDKTSKILKLSANRSSKTITSFARPVNYSVIKKHPFIKCTNIARKEISKRSIRSFSTDGTDKISNNLDEGHRNKISPIPHTSYSAKENERSSEIVRGIKISPKSILDAMPPLEEASSNDSRLLKRELMEAEYQTVCQYVNRKRYAQLKIKAEEAMRNETIFAIIGHSNGYHTVRKFFYAKGWVERFADGEEKVFNNLPHAPDTDSLVISKLVSKSPVKFIWADGVINWQLIDQSTMVNKFPYGSKSISTKTGLLQHLQNQHWTYNPNFAFVKYPRTVSIINEDDMKHFASQYRISACVCMLKHFVESYDAKKILISENGVVPLDCIDFAIRRICEFVTFEEGTDVDNWNISVVSEDDWILFLLRFHDIAHFNVKYKNNSDYDETKLMQCAKKCIARIRDFWPDIEVEGVKNLWIIKPGASSCGRGIRIFKSLVEIVNHCKPGSSYIAQRYIERPMIIYKTKFDIRQWFVVTSVQPLIVYMYNTCYLRFCSKEFSLVNLHESIHLSNNSVQCRYQNVSNRSCELPSDNMWDSDQFLSYLRSRKEDDKWYAIALPGMRKGIVGALLASQQHMVHRPNCFHLFGADFMLTEDFVPWLLEINGGPCLRNTTSVTARLCPMVIQDTINLALNKKNSNGSLDCGQFRLIYSQKLFPQGLGQKNEINLKGKKAKLYSKKDQTPRTPPFDKLYSQVLSLDTYENVNSPLTYASRSLNYEQMANYKTYKDHGIKQKPVPFANRIPMGPGSILSRYEVNYSVTNVRPFPKIPYTNIDMTGTFHTPFESSNNPEKLSKILLGNINRSKINLNKGSTQTNKESDDIKGKGEKYFMKFSPSKHTLLRQNISE